MHRANSRADRKVKEMKIDNNLMAELLCIADTEWVLGHWYTRSLMNSRNLQDATALGAMSQDTWGHTRAIFRYLEEENNLPDFQIEFGRKAVDVHNMDMLDNPPQSYGDYILTTYLAELAVWRLMATFKDGNHADIASMMTAFGKECYFHRLNSDGWFTLFTEEEKNEAINALPARLGAAIAWFGTDKASSECPLLESGVRSQSVSDAREMFIKEATAKLAKVLDITEQKVEALVDSVNPSERNNRRRRVEGSEMPAALWEYVVPTNEGAILARRPLSISVQDEIDLWDKPETIAFDYD